MNEQIVRESHCVHNEVISHRRSTAQDLDTLQIEDFGESGARAKAEIAHLDGFVVKVDADRAGTRVRVDPAGQDRVTSSCDSFERQCRRHANLVIDLLGTQLLHRFRAERRNADRHFRQCFQLPGSRHDDLAIAGWCSGGRWLGRLRMATDTPSEAADAAQRNFLRNSLIIFRPYLR